MQTSKKVIYAGGGLVLSEGQDVLMIYRNGFWDLPKGKWEKGESIQQCAVREVMEECGLQEEVMIGRRLITTVHHYEQEGVEYEKHTAWYLMLAQGEVPPPLTPQAEEGIEKAEWVTIEQARDLVQTSYSTIQEVFDAFLGGIKK